MDCLRRGKTWKKPSETKKWDKRWAWNGILLMTCFENRNMIAILEWIAPENEEEDDVEEGEEEMT